MLSINTNLSSIITKNSMKKSTNTLNETVERMSTGYKINHARDNAANYSINTKMTTKIGGYQVAEDNAAMGLDMLNTASDNLSVMQSKATRLRELAIQARNGTYGGSSLSAIQAEANAIYEEINRIYSTAEYNGVKLFNQSEYDIPDNMPKADPITGFIENPYDYTEDDLKNITSISKVTDSFTESTYKIETVDDLVKLAELTNNGVDTTGKTFVLANDLDLKEYCEQHEAEGGWTPIGIETNSFKGSFNGNGQVIYNLTINRPNSDFQGLFRYTVGSNNTISNLALEDVKIKGYSNVAAISGATGCNFDNCYVTGEINAHDKAGMLIGSCYTYQQPITNCYAIGDIEASAFVGGLVGNCYAALKNCFSDCNVTGISRVGGLIGSLFTPSGGRTFDNVISLSKVVGNDIETTGSFIGGFVVKYAANDYVAKISTIDCYATEQAINKIGSAYEYDNGSLVLFPDYDLSTILSGITSLQSRNISTNLQIGTKSESASQLSLNTNFELDLGKVVRFGIGSDFALSAIDDFVNLLSKKQTEYGANQNRLMSVLDEIKLQQENLISARSTTRDADIAKVSSTYIQQQILQQASATLMATANQIPAIALQLI